MKLCRECGEVRPLSEFYRHERMADGHLNYCKSCVKARVARHRDEHIKAIRAKDRERATRPERVALRQAVASRWKADPEFRKRSVVLKQEWQARNPEKRAAHIAVGNALRDGRLQRQTCEVCGSPVTQAHHDDYGKPLIVRWLCRMHHTEHHKLLRRQGIDPDYNS